MRCNILVHKEMCVLSTFDCLKNKLNSFLNFLYREFVLLEVILGSVF